MKKSKRLLAVLLALSMTATLAACSPGESDEPSTDPSISGNQPSNEETLPAGETGGASASEPSLDESTDTLPVSGDVSATQPSEKQPQEEKSTAPKADENDPTKMSKAALINYYNTAANDAKSKAKSITKTQNQASLAKAPQINNGILESIANTLMKAFLSDSPKSVNETYSSAAEKKENFYVGGQSYSSKLTASDVTSATCKKSGSNYVVTLKVKGSSVSKAFSTISKNQITDAVKGMVKFNSIDISYSDSTIQATVGPNGKLQKVYYDMPAVTMNFDRQIGKWDQSIPCNPLGRLVYDQLVKTINKSRVAQRGVLQNMQNALFLYRMNNLYLLYK